ncbi:hypothetical protein [Amazonocrinis nigriterrae]|nr:hypothetical protein [Amazonocrinis nigriterrae]
MLSRKAASQKTRLPCHHRISDRSSEVWGVRSLTLPQQAMAL